MMNSKDSGLNWIGEIPEEWDITKIKYTAQLNGRIGWQGLTSSEYQEEGPYLITGTDFDNGAINFETAVHIEERRWEEAKQIQVKNGDLLITKDGTVGKVAIISGLNDKASLNSGVLRIQPIDSVDSKFLYYVLLSEEFWLWFNYTNSGASTILHLYQNVFDNFTYALPPLDEQKRIVKHLNNKVGYLTKTRNVLEKQIEKLQEYRKSLMWETVTKGLDSSVETKYSGVDWIENIPVNWEIKRLKDLVRFQTGGTPKESAGVNQQQNGTKWYKPGDFKDGSILLTESENYIEDEVIREKKILIYPPNTVLIVGIASIGKVGISEDSSYSNQQITALLNRGEVESKYLAYVMAAMSDFIKDTALYTVVPIINNQYLSTLKIPFPTLEYQKNIIEHLDDKNTLINKIIENKQKQIDVINEQKKTLIYDYVTGKRRIE